MAEKIAENISNPENVKEEENAQFGGFQPLADISQVNADDSYLSTFEDPADLDLSASEDGFFLQDGFLPEAEENVGAETYIREMIGDIKDVYDLAGEAGEAANNRLLKDLPAGARKGLKWTYQHFTEKNYPCYFLQPLPPALIKARVERQGLRPDWPGIRSACMKLVEKIKKAIGDIGLQFAREMNLTLAQGSDRKRAQMELGLNIFHGALCCYAGFVGALDQFVKAEAAYDKIRYVFSDTLILLKNVMALDIMQEEARICSENRGFTVSEVQKSGMPVRGEILVPMLKANLEPSISCLKKAKDMLQKAVDLLARLKAGQDLADQAQTDKVIPVAAPEGLEYVVERARDMNLLGDKKEPLPKENCFSYNGKSYLHLDPHHFYESTGYNCFLTAKAASTKSDKLNKMWRKYWREVQKPPLPSTAALANHWLTTC